MTHISKENLVCPLKGYVTPALFPTLVCIIYISNIRSPQLDTLIIQDNATHP